MPAVNDPLYCHGALTNVSFLQRYIYVADTLAHEIHVLEKHPNMNLTQLKVNYFFIYKGYINLLYSKLRNYTIL